MNHTTDGHKTKEELQKEKASANVARVSFNMHPSAFKVRAPTIGEMFKDDFRCNLGPKRKKFNHDDNNGRKKFSRAKPAKKNRSNKKAKETTSRATMPTVKKVHYQSRTAPKEDHSKITVWAKV